MKVTSKEEMGLRCMMRLAEQSSGDKQTSISDLAKAEGLKPGYVGKIISQLRHGGLVKSVRGAGGRIELTKPPEEITLDTIISVMSTEKSSRHVPVIEAGKSTNCNRYPNCNMKAAWDAVARMVQESLSRVSLYDLIWGNPQSIIRAISGSTLTKNTKKIHVITTTIRRQNKEESK